MAHAALVSVLQLLEDHSINEDHSHNLFSIKQQIKDLGEKFYFLQSFLENDDSPKTRQANVNSLETRIRQVAYQAQDIIESHASDHPCPQKQSIVESYVSNELSPKKQNPDDDPNRRVKNPSWRRLSSVIKFISLLNKPHENVHLSVNNFDVNNFDKLYRDLQNVADEVDCIVIEAIKINQSQKTEEKGFQFSNSTPHPTVGSPRIAKTNMVGFEEDLMEIKDQLCGGSSSKLQVIPIVGMGGIGKTTLATNLFHDPLIAYHFHIRAWITITQRYNMRDILLALLSSVTATTEKLNRETENGLAECLYKSLKGRKYLIVLDDMWNTEAWDDLKMLFPNDSNGSRIILTTRLLYVASYANSFGPCHQVQFLNEDQSWKLFQEKVFGQECYCPIELEEIGKLIVRNCRGLPLSIVVVGGILSRADKKRYWWENVARDVSSFVREDDEHFSSKILSLSYTHLPHHLKACFLYFGGFPEDYEIPVFKLISLWVAEGFLKPDKSKSPEQVAEEHLEDLVKRSLVLITKKRYNGRFRFCSIHDLLRDLCIRKAREEKFLHLIDGIQETIQNKHRLCFVKFVEWYHFKNPSSIRSNTRSIFWRLYVNDMVTGFRLLRVLDVLEVSFKCFPVEILELFHLRYVAFSTGFIRCCTLPPSLHELRNLQTLIFGSSVTTSSAIDSLLAAGLPIWKMPKLRHLVFMNIKLSPFPDEELPALENLQTLSRVKNFNFTNKAIDMIPNLKTLKVFYTSGSRLKGVDHGLNNLVHLQKLETLNLKFLPSPDWWRDPIPLSFELPLNLKKLTLSGWGLSWKDMTKIGSLPNLEVLKLLNLSVLGLEWEPIEGEFTSLKFLVMEWLDIKCWLAESSHFPRLERLVIRHCAALESIPCEIGEIPTLEMIEVEDSEMAAESAQLILDEQRAMGNDLLQVRVALRPEIEDFSLVDLFYQAKNLTNS